MPRAVLPFLGWASVLSGDKDRVKLCPRHVPKSQRTQGSRFGPIRPAHDSIRGLTLDGRNKSSNSSFTPSPHDTKSRILSINQRYDKNDTAKGMGGI